MYLYPIIVDIGTSPGVLCHIVQRKPAESDPHGPEVTGKEFGLENGEYNWIMGDVMSKHSV